VLPVVTPSASGIYLRVETQTLDAVEAAAATQAARGEMDVSNAAAAALARALMEAGRSRQSVLRRHYDGLTSGPFSQRFAACRTEEDGAC
jgi:hypothetical protein